MPQKHWPNENKNPKAFFHRYLKNVDEPKDTSSFETAPELKAELLEDSYIMRKRFRFIAKTLRDYF